MLIFDNFISIQLTRQAMGADRNSIRAKDIKGTGRKNSLVQLQCELRQPLPFTRSC